MRASQRRVGDMRIRHERLPVELDGVLSHDAYVNKTTVVGTGCATRGALTRTAGFLRGAGLAGCATAPLLTIRISTIAPLGSTG